MIEQAIMNYLKSNLQTDMLISMNFTTRNDNTIVVYSDPGEQPSMYEGQLIQPRYQIIVKSSDFAKATAISLQIYDLLHQYRYDTMTVSYKTREIDYNVYSIDGLHLPARLGVDEDNIMSYSLNFQSQIKKANERKK
ncbi:minor capsid protein [Staphylococcus saprophyticus]|nr:minor capsid protein [Staphylococcus saprophyticus]MDW4219818.1 minor capsid protein [Staphylococcus saprophyticus]MDW4338227.1 minor capsid protein [Staphylococcus saprophyticus]